MSHTMHHEPRGAAPPVPARMGAKGRKRSAAAPDFVLQGGGGLTQPGEHDLPLPEPQSSPFPPKTAPTWNPLGYPSLSLMESRGSSSSSVARL